MAKDDPPRYKKQRGNVCIYFLYNLFNLLFLLSSLLVIGMGAWLWYEVEKVGPFNLGFIILGSVQFLLSLLGQNVKKSKAKMNIYLFFVGLMFIAQTLCTSIGIASKSQIIDWAAKRADSPEEAAKIKSLIENNVETALWVTIAPVVIQFFCLWTIYLYRRSFINRNTSKELLLQDDNGQTISLKEKYRRDDAAIKEKYDNIRMKQKRQSSESDVESNRSSAVYEDDRNNKKKGKR